MRRARTRLVLGILLAGGLGAAPPGALGKPRPGRARPREPYPPATTPEGGASAEPAGARAANGERPQPGVPAQDVPVRRRARAAAAEAARHERGAAPAAERGAFDAAPALLRLEVAGALVGRRFGYDAPLQREAALARAGFRVGVEWSGRGLLPGAWQGLGLAGAWAQEGGVAELERDDSLIVRHPVRQRRLWVDALYAVRLTDSLWLQPRAGLGDWRYEVAGGQVLPPSGCPRQHPDVCLARVGLTHARLGAGARAALARDWGLDGSLVGLAGLKLDGRPGGLASEARVRSQGVAAEIGVSRALSSWFVLRAAVDASFVQHDFTGAATVAYRHARETYYGLALAAVLRAPP